jgi:hypothetical protein
MTDSFTKYLYTYLIFIGFFVLIVGYGAVNFLNIEIGTPTEPAPSGNWFTAILNAGAWILDLIVYPIKVIWGVSTTYPWFALLILTPGIFIGIWGIMRFVRGGG